MEKESSIRLAKMLRSNSLYDAHQAEQEIQRENGFKRLQKWRAGGEGPIGPWHQKKEG